MPSAASARPRPSSRRRSSSIGSPRRSTSRPPSCGDAWPIAEGDVTPTGQVLRHSVAAVDVLERAVEASAFEVERARTARERVGRSIEAAHDRDSAPGSWPGPERIASGVGLALGWHGGGFTGSGEKMLASVAGAEVGADGKLRILTAQTEIGQGAATVLPQIAAEVLGVAPDEVEPAPLDTALVPNSGPTVASRTTMVVGGLVASNLSLRREVEARTGRPFAESYREDARARATRSTPASRLPRHRVGPGRSAATQPAFSWRRRWPSSTSTRHGGRCGPRVVAVDEPVAS